MSLKTHHRRSETAATARFFLTFGAFPQSKRQSRNPDSSIQKVSRDIIPDMPDRIIAATALHLDLPLVTRDQKIQAAGITTIW